jgi:hypothetical protein
MLNIFESIVYLQADQKKNNYIQNHYNYTHYFKK